MSGVQVNFLLHARDRIPALLELQDDAVSRFSIASNICSVSHNYFDIYLAIWNEEGIDDDHSSLYLLRKPRRRDVITWRVRRMRYKPS